MNANSFPDTKSLKIKISICEKFPGEKLPDGDPRWKEHTESFEPREITITELIMAIKAGYAFCPEVANNHRKTENFISAQHLGLDFDTGDEQSSLEVLANDEFISKYAAFLYTTPSHTPEKPRARAVFILDKPIEDAKEYSQYATALTRKFELSDGQCKDAARFFYGSKGCYGKILNNILPISILEEISEYIPRREKKERYRPPRGVSPKENERAEKALDMLSQERCDEYGSWVEVGMCLKEGLGHEGLPLWINWSQQSNKFKEDECEKKWETFENDKGLTLASLYHWAKEDNPELFSDETEDVMDEDQKYFTDLGNAKRFSST